MPFIGQRDWSSDVCSSDLMREKSGRFRRVEDLLAIRGISDKRLAKLRPYVTVSPQSFEKK
jgi:type II secretory pathway component PulK